MENNKKEIRSFTDGCELRAVSKTRNIEGYGIVFNSKSKDLGGFKEIIKPEAMDGVIEESDILVLLNHDISRGVLARSVYGNGTLKLEKKSKGVFFSFQAPDTSLSQELIEGINRGDIRGSSVAFTIAPGGEEIKQLEDGSYIRTITKFQQLYDISPCYREAYQDTTVAVRSLDEFKKLNEDPPAEDPEPTVGDPPVVNSADKTVRPPLSNAELAMRARNELHKKNIL